VLHVNFLFHTAASPARAARSLNSAFPDIITDKVDHVKGAIDMLKSKHHQQPAIIAPNYLITQQPQYVVAAMPQYAPPPTIIVGNPTPQPVPAPPPTVEEKEVTVSSQLADSLSSAATARAAKAQSQRHQQEQQQDCHRKKQRPGCLLLAFQCSSLLRCYMHCKHT
jgi:hypothetical protein